MFPDISYSGWVIGIIAALFAGLGKGGLPGAGNLSVALMAMVFAGKESVGILLPILICADIAAVWVYHKHADWKQLLRLLPWTLIGIGIGALIFGHIDDKLLIRSIGAILLIMVGLRFVVSRFQKQQGGLAFKSPLTRHVFVGFTGITGVSPRWSPTLRDLSLPFICWYRVCRNTPSSVQAPGFSSSST